MKKLPLVLLTLSFIGTIDASYLAFEHFSHKIAPCYVHAFFSDCGKVLSSSYAAILNVPVPYIGVVYYLSLILLTALFIFNKNNKVFTLLALVSCGGFLMSLYFVFLQLFVIHAICLYCMTSAIISTSLFLIISYSGWDILQNYGKS